MCKILPIMVCLVFFLTSCAHIGYELGMAKCAPVYGNWCGEDYPLDGYNPEPVDVWDGFCRDHDKCYEEAGNMNFNKEQCDKEFVYKIRQESLKRRFIPIAIRNAHEFFRKGRYGDNKLFKIPGRDFGWSMGADCRGGDGEAALFCVYGPGRNQYCELTNRLQMAFFKKFLSRTDNDCICPDIPVRGDSVRGYIAVSE